MLTTPLRPLLSLSLCLFSADALACGGFFCSQLQMDQSKERIVFAIDEEEGKVDAHIQIFYQGEAPEFAWVVPVAGVPEVSLSTEALFTQLEWRTAPQFNLNWREEGTCTYERGGFWGAVDEDLAAGGPPQASPEGDGGVVVINEAQVGPYDQVTLQASSSELLLDWLNNAGYAIPATIGDALDPYLADGNYVVALKLQSDRSAGDIAPVKLRYTADHAGIPIVLTSIAATPDMRLQPYVFAQHRAVPSGYLHVKINEAAIDWFSGGANYDDVITRAANEAGGHAFATDFAGSTDGFENAIVWNGTYDLSVLDGVTDPIAYVDQLMSLGVPGNSALQNLFRRYLPLPQSAIDANVDELSFYNCLGCYSEYVAEIDFDAEGMTADLYEEILAPMEEANALFSDYPYLTRLTSSMSPEEMTEDPIFVTNPDMEDVSNQHQAELVIVCGDGGEVYEAPLRLELADGREILLPPMSWLEDNDATYAQFAADLEVHSAETIEQTGATGAPVAIADFRSAVDEAISTHNAWVSDELGYTAAIDDETTVAGCGCASSGRSTGWLALLTLLPALARRRRA